MDCQQPAWSPGREARLKGPGIVCGRLCQARALTWPPVAWAAVLCAAALLPAQETLPRCDLLPGWKQAGAARLYTADTLRDYMDGNSEGYLIYGFDQMQGVTCKSADASFVIDISKMKDPESAFGLFASSRDPRVPTEAIGVLGQVTPQRGIFVKGERFVEISASPPLKDHSAEIRAFLTALEAKMDGTTSPPAPVGWFPAQGLDANSIRLIPQSVLGLSLLKRGYLAKYDFGRAFIVKQPSADSAIQLMGRLRDKFGDAIEPAAIGDEGFETTDKYLGHLLFFRKGPYIAGFTSLAEDFDAAAVAEVFAARIP